MTSTLVSIWAMFDYVVSQAEASDPVAHSRDAQD